MARAHPTLKLGSDAQRRLAVRWIEKAPIDCLVIFKKPTRTLDQNALMWVLLTEVAKAKKHNGIWRSPESWKCLFMHGLGYRSEFEIGLEGEPFPTGFKTSQLNKEKMSELIEFIFSWGAENGIEFSEKPEAG
jgi:NinB protein